MQAIAAMQNIAGMRDALLGVFSRIDALQQAVEQLSPAGFDASRLGLMCQSTAVRTKLKDYYEETPPAERYEGGFDFAERGTAPASALSYLGGLWALEGDNGSDILVSSALMLGPFASAHEDRHPQADPLVNAFDDPRRGERLHNYLGQHCLLLFVGLLDEREEARAREILARFIGVYTESFRFRAPWSSAAGNDAADRHLASSRPGQTLTS